MKSYNRLCNFTFHNVGHGLFYTGCFTSFRPHNTVTFVYDCGSISAKRFLRSAVDEFKRSINGNVIDLLVISHLDEDHANGLEFLLSDPTKVKVKFAILPYLSNLERLYIIASTKSQNQGYIRFLVDPVKYLLRKGIKKVYLMRGGKTGGETPTSPDEPPPDNIPINFDKGSFNFKRDNYLGKLLKINMPSWKRYIRSGKLVPVSHKGYVDTGVWLFKFFVAQVDKKILKCFDKQVKKRFPNWVISDFTTKANRKTLRRIYKSNFSKVGGSRDSINNTSIVTLHRSLVRNHVLVRAVSLCNVTGTPYHRVLHLQSCGHLLTGDVNFRYEKVFSEMKNHFDNDLMKITGVMLPHHGSQSSWNDKLLCSTSAHLFYVSSKYGDTKHPAKSLVRRILCSGREVICVNEFSSCSESIYL
jgi:hypothetical protein